MDKHHFIRRYSNYRALGVFLIVLGLIGAFLFVMADK